MKHILAAFIWLLCCSTPSLAQDSRPLNVKITDSIRVHEPEWLLDREYPATYSGHCKCDMLVADWERGGARLLAIVYAHKSKEDADATYKSLMEWYSVSDARETDESYLWELPGIYVTRGHPGGGSKMYAYFLRSGGGVLMVVGDSPGLVKRFAALIAAELTAA